MKKESELNAVEAFGMLGVACAAAAVGVGLLLRNFAPKKAVNYGFHSTPEEIKEFVKTN